MSKTTVALALLLTAASVLAASPGEVLQTYAAQAKKDSPAFKEFSAANKARFTDTPTVEKWFKRNCQDVLERECTAQEKGDFMTYVLSIK